MYGLLSLCPGASFNHWNIVPSENSICFVCLLCFLFACLFYLCPLSIVILELHCGENQVHLPERAGNLFLGKTSSTAEFSAYDYYEPLIQPEVAGFVIRTANILSHTLGICRWLSNFQNRLNFLSFITPPTPTPVWQCLTGKPNVCWRKERRPANIFSVLPKCFLSHALSRDLL